MRGGRGAVPAAPGGTLSAASGGGQRRVGSSGTTSEQWRPWYASAQNFSNGSAAEEPCIQTTRSRSELVVIDNYRLMFRSGFGAGTCVPALVISQLRDAGTCRRAAPVSIACSPPLRCRLTVFLSCVINSSSLVSTYPATPPAAAAAATLVLSRAHHHHDVLRSAALRCAHSRCLPAPPVLSRRRRVLARLGPHPPLVFVGPLLEHDVGVGLRR